MKSHHVDLLNEAIAPALTRLALPIMATSLVQMLYNLTDMAWIGRLGAGAVTAVGSAGMYTWFSQGFAILARTGGQVKTAHCLGAGENDSAAQYARVPALPIGRIHPKRNGRLQRKTGATVISGMRMRGQSMR